MSKLIRSDFLKKFKLVIPNFKNYDEIKKLDAPLIVKGLDEFLKSRLPTWKKGEKNIEKKYEFEDFKKAFGFMTEVANIADYIDHHPDWFNVYNRVNVKLNTHDKNGVTMKDLFLAFSMDKIYENVSSLSLPKGKLVETEINSKHFLNDWND